MRVTLWPRSLAGQLALLLAIALFVAQAINFALLLSERQRLREAQVSGPAIARIADAVEGVRPLQERRRRGPVTRVTRAAANPIPADADDQRDVAERIATGLADQGIATRQVRAAVVRVAPDDPSLAEMGQRRARWIRRNGAELVVAVERPGEWLVLRSNWPRGDRFLVGRLILQTVVLYIVVLLPVLWIARRIARPLRALTAATAGFRPGEPQPPLTEEGPGDVRAVIAAHNALTARVGAMLDEKDRMLGAIGHDLRTPLAALRVRIENVEDDEDRTRMAGIIDEMSGTLEDILSLARIGKPSEAITEVDLSALVDAVVDDFRDLDRPVEAEDAPRLLVRLRPTLMRRAVRNLVENAIKYAGAAEVRLVAEPGRALIEVADRGPGIPADRREAVFGAFTRMEHSRNRDTGGIGLGLALARAIVRDAGGEVTLDDRPGGGLIARIVLPR